MANVGKKNFEVIIGDTFSEKIVFFNDETLLLPKDLTGYSFKMQVRKCDDSDVLLEFISPTSIDITNAALGEIILNASAGTTALLLEQVAVYDLYWIDTFSNVKTVLEGSINILKRITQP